MKKIIITSGLLIVVAFAFSFNNKNLNEDNSFLIITENAGTLIISRGNGQSELIDMKGNLTDNAFKVNNDVMITQLNKLKKEGYEIKTSYSLHPGNYSILFEKK